MFSYKKFKKTEINELVDKISNFYDTDANSLKQYNFYLNENNGKLYITKIDIEELELRKISGFGLYFATIHDNNRLRLSIEGSLLINPKKNYIKINKEVLKSYLAGEDIFKEEIDEISWEDNCPFLIVIHDNKNIGSTNIKDKTSLNYVPKSRRLDFNKLF